MNKSYILTPEELYKGCRILVWMNFVLSVSMFIFFPFALIGPRVMSYIVLGIAFGEGEKWQLSVCGLVIVIYIVSLILLWRKKRIFAVGPMLLHAAGVISTIYLAIAVAEEPMAVLGGLPFLLTCFEAWEAFMFFRCFFRCKDIKALTQKNDNRTESVTIK